jgi:hypothetical protein
LPQISGSSFFCARFPQKSTVVAAGCLQPSPSQGGRSQAGARVFDLARGLGLNVSDTDHLWNQQINKVHD